MGDFDLVTATDVRLMQGLAQRITAIRPDLVNSDATFGELAWIWGKDHASDGGTWPRRLWFSGDALVAWGWAYLPHRVRRSDGSVTDVTGAYLGYQVHPGHAALVDDVISCTGSGRPGDADQSPSERRGTWRRSSLPIRYRSRLEVDRRRSEVNASLSAEARTTWLRSRSTDDAGSGYGFGPAVPAKPVETRLSLARSARNRRGPRVRYGFRAGASTVIACILTDRLTRHRSATPVPGPSSMSGT